MTNISKNTYKKRLAALQKTAQTLSCDALLIYNAEKEDPSLLPWATGAYIFDTTYLLVKSSETIIFVPQWRLEEADKAFDKTDAKIVGTKEKTTMMVDIIPFMKDVQTIGYAGNLPYKEALTLKGMKLIDSEQAIRRLQEIKDSEEIEIMRKARNFTVKFLDDINWGDWVGKSELEISTWISDEMKSQQLPIAHLCLSTGDRMKETTAGYPSDKILDSNDPICIDFGIGMSTYYSDITRCYFLGEAAQAYTQPYATLKNIVEKTAETIKSGTASKEIFTILKSQFTTHGVEDSFVPADLGHGIGTGNHEYPEIGFDEYEMEPGIVFTIEPEMKLPDNILLRYEDIFYIDQDGTCKLLK